MSYLVMQTYENHCNFSASKVTARTAVRTLEKVTRLYVYRDFIYKLFNFFNNISAD